MMLTTDLNKVGKHWIARIKKCSCNFVTSKTPNICDLDTFYMRL